MAYYFKHPGRSVQKELRRIAARQIEGAIVALDARAPLDETVHEVRKRCKKLRGLVRLVRPCFDDYARENAAFRDAADALGVLRDAAVLLSTYNSIAAAHRGEMRAFAGIRKALLMRQRQTTANSRHVAHLFAQVRATLVAAGERAAHWTIDDGGFDALDGGLAKTYKRARKAMRAAAEDSRDEDFHEWRKRVKYHGYHARLLEPLWPNELKAHRKAAEDINDLLGEHHDLGVFADVLRREADTFGDADDVDAFVALLRQRQDALATEAFALGRRLFAEPPGALTQRWRAWWTIWHKETPEQRAAMAA
jgi:CHAD domain-containing protein